MNVGGVRESKLSQMVACAAADFLLLCKICCLPRPERIYVIVPSHAARLAFTNRLLRERTVKSVTSASGANRVHKVTIDCCCRREEELRCKTDDEQ